LNTLAAAGEKRTKDGAVKPLTVLQLPAAPEGGNGRVVPATLPSFTRKKFQGQGITTVFRVPGLDVTLLFSATGRLAWGMQ
jgi:hypothetical protein